MNTVKTSMLLFVIILTTGADLSASDYALTKAVASDSRSENFARRDISRHPQEVLEFFGIRPDMAVAEIWPSSGWWSEILAPYLADNGSYYAVGYSLSARRTPQWRKNMAQDLNKKFKQSPDQFGKVIVTSLSVPEDTEIAPPASLDLVLTFRNVHNWIKGGYAAGVFEAMFIALKPGGIMGLVEHRAPVGVDIEFMKRSGYVSEAYVISAAKAAGFELIDQSELNANPKDNKDHPAGVWSLPPSLRYCSSLDDQTDAEACHQKYQAIGESDRMTLKFTKPAELGSK